MALVGDGKAGVTLLGVAVVMNAVFWARPIIEPAAYKDLAQSLATVGASLDTEFHGIAGTISVVRNDTVPTRQAPGLSLQSAALPPRQLAVFLDGDAVGFEQRLNLLLLVLLLDRQFFCIRRRAHGRSRTGYSAGMAAPSDQELGRQLRRRLYGF